MKRILTVLAIFGFVSVAHAEDRPRVVDISSTLPDEHGVATLTWKNLGAEPAYNLVLESHWCLAPTDKYPTDPVAFFQTCAKSEAVQFSTPAPETSIRHIGLSWPGNGSIIWRRFTPDDLNAIASAKSLQALCVAYRFTYSLNGANYEYVEAMMVRDYAGSVGFVGIMPDYSSVTINLVKTKEN